MMTEEERRAEWEANFKKKCELLADHVGQYVTVDATLLCVNLGQRGDVISVDVDIEGVGVHEIYPGWVNVP